MDLRKFFQRESEEDPETQIDPRQQHGSDLAAELHAVTVEQLVRGGVVEDCITLEMRSVARAPDGRPVYVGMLRLVRWEPTSALRLLLGLPILQAKVRRAIRTSWLHEVSIFSGLWLHPSGQFEESSAMRDLRGMILQIEQSAAFAARRSAEQGPALSVWSVPQELQDSGRHEP